MQQKAAESHSVISIRNSSQTALFSAIGCSDSINNQTQNHVMSQLPVTSVLDGSMTSLANRHLPNRLSMAANSSDTLSEPQMNNYQFVEGLDLGGGNHGCNVSDLFKSAVNYGCEGLSTSRWDFNKFLSPSQELLDRALARNGVHSIPWTQSSNLGQPPNQFSSELSLSLSMSEPPRFMQGPSIQEQCSEMSSISSGEILHNRIVALDHTSCSNSSNKFNNPGGDCSRRLSPFMAGSKAFLQAMQEILAEIAFYAVENLEQMAYSSSSSSSCTMIDFSGGNGDSRFVVQSNTSSFQRESEEKKKLLVALLQLVDDRYSQCIDEIHTVVSAFHAVTELDPNLHARFALPTISFMCKNLRERISSSILAMGSSCHHSSSEDKSFEASFIQKQWALQQLKKRDHQLWRPQRGLPERSVSVLRAWMFQNFLHPYPKDAEKHLLALKSGLTRSQVSNWFINARVRLWKPMIEEMYAEMNKRKAAGGGEDNAEAAAAARNHMRRGDLQQQMGWALINKS